MLLQFPCQAIQLTLSSQFLRRIIFVFCIKRTNVGSQSASVDCQDKKVVRRHGIMDALGLAHAPLVAIRYHFERVASNVSGG